MIKLEGVYYLLQRWKEKKRRIEGERGCWPGHKLNITNDIIDGIH